MRCMTALMCCCLFRSCLFRNLRPKIGQFRSLNFYLSSLLHIFIGATAAFAGKRRFPGHSVNLRSSALPLDTLFAISHLLWWYTLHGWCVLVLVEAGGRELIDRVACVHDHGLVLVILNFFLTDIDLMAVIVMILLLVKRVIILTTIWVLFDSWSIVVLLILLLLFLLLIFSIWYQIIVPEANARSWGHFSTQKVLIKTWLLFLLPGLIHIYLMGRRMHISIKRYIIVLIIHIVIRLSFWCEIMIQVAIWRVIVLIDTTHLETSLIHQSFMTQISSILVLISAQGLIHRVVSDAGDLLSLVKLVVRVISGTMLVVLVGIVRSEWNRFFDLPLVGSRSFFENSSGRLFLPLVILFSGNLCILLAFLLLILISSIFFFVVICYILFSIFIFSIFVQITNCAAPLIFQTPLGCAFSLVLRSQEHRLEISLPFRPISVNKLGHIFRLFVGIGQIHICRLFSTWDWIPIFANSPRFSTRICPWRG